MLINGHKYSKYKLSLNLIMEKMYGLSYFLKNMTYYMEVIESIGKECQKVNVIKAKTSAKRKVTETIH